MELGLCRASRPRCQGAGQPGAAGQASQAGELVPVAPTPSSLALAWFFGTQTGLMSSWAAGSLTSRKVELLESRGREAWAQRGLFPNILPHPRAPPTPAHRTFLLGPEPGSCRLIRTPLFPPPLEGTRSLGDKEGDLLFVNSVPAPTSPDGLQCQGARLPGLHARLQPQFPLLHSQAYSE